MSNRLEVEVTHHAAGEGVCKTSKLRVSLSFEGNERVAAFDISSELQVGGLRYGLPSIATDAGNLLSKLVEEQMAVVKENERLDRLTEETGLNIREMFKHYEVNTLEGLLRLVDEDNRLLRQRVQRLDNPPILRSPREG